MNKHTRSMPPDGRHRYQVRVYYEDTDAGGVVYHASYLRFAERARTEALRDLGIPHAEMVERYNLMFMVRRIELDYLRPARPDDSLIVETEAVEVGGATVQLHQSVLGPHGLCADLRIRLACVRVGGGSIGVAPTERGRTEETKPGRIPPRWRVTLNALRDAGQKGVQGRGSGS